MADQHIHVTFLNDFNELLFYSEVQNQIGVAIHHHHIDLDESPTIYTRIAFSEENALDYAQQSLLHQIATNHLGGEVLPSTVPGPYLYTRTDIDSALIHHEVEISPLISKNIDYINKNPSGIQIYFQEDLIQTEVDVLSTIVENHSEDFLPPLEKIGISIEDLSPSLLAFIAGESKGSFYRYKESAEVSTTTSTSWQNKLVISLSDIQDAVYRVSWAYSWNMDDTAEDFEVSIEMHDAVSTIEELFFHKEEAKDDGGSFGATGTDQRHSISSFAARRMDGVRTIVIKWRSGKSGKKASIWGAKLEIEKVSEDTTSVLGN